jgi:uncharacterized protein with HEPN domain
MPSDAERLRRWLADAARNIDLAEEFLVGVSQEAFEGDHLRQYAVVRCLEIISEASRRLPAELKARHPGIPWREIATAGNVYRHEYGRVAPRRVWTTVHASLPALRVVIAEELARLG